ncbi:MAG: tetratricopeptide repeat protein [Bacteroidetes bacterium]|nr:MAG: tetratricopeptide repeat protein [Bacteroidota bacterium]
MRQTLYLCLCLLGLFPLSGLQAQEEHDDILAEIGRTIEQGGRRLVEAIEYYSRALRFDPHNAAGYNNRATALYQQGEFRRAIIDYTRALHYYPPQDHSRRARIHYQRGLCYYILQEYDLAVEDFSQAISYRPDITDSYYFRGKIRHHIKGDPELARADLETVIRLADGESVQAAFSRFFLGDLSEAASVMTRLLATTRPDDRDAYARICYTMAGLQGLIGNDLTTVKYLRLALEHGYPDLAWLARDPNFRPVADSEVFRQFLRDRNLAYYLPAGAAVEVVPYTHPAQAREVPPAPLPVPITRGDLPQAPADLQLSEVRFRDAGGDNRIDAGEEAWLSLTVTNRGTGPATDLQLLLEEQSGLSGLALPAPQDLGSLVPGAQRQLEVRLQGDETLATGQALLRVSVQEGNGFDAVPIEVSVPTLAFQPPRLEVVDHHFASELGGRMQLGVPILVKLAVQNTGPGPAESVAVRMLLPDQVFPAGADSYQVGDMQPGESKVIDFEFFTNRRYAAQSVPVTVQITEARGDFGAEATLSVALNEQLEVSGRVVINAREMGPIDYGDIQLMSDVDRNLPRTGRKNPNAIAVVIGNRDYQNPDVPPVDYALQDAGSMRKYLVESFGFEEDNILFLANATQADMNGIFGTPQDHRARLYNLVKEGETDLFVFYSGHGAPDLETQDAYFVPVDCDPSLVRFNGYAIQTFYDNLAKLPYRSLTVVIDACFSGTSDRGTLIPYASLVRIKSNNNVLKDPRAMVFTAASGTQIASWYPEQAHGLFTYHFLKGLQGEADQNRDREVSLGEMRTYLSESVPAMARRLNNRVQNPEIYGLDERVLLGPLR